MPFGYGEGLGLGSLGMGLYGLFNRGNNPSDAAMQYLKNIPGYAEKGYRPYMDAGTSMMPGMNDLYQQMMQNPGEFFNKIGAGYKESPGYQHALKEAMGGIGNAAASGGMAGSPMHQQLAGEEASDMASKDFQQYINNVLGIQDRGTTGGENTVGRGFDATGRYVDTMGSNAAAQAGLAYKGTDWQNRENNQNWANIFGGASMLMPWMFGQ